MKKLSIFLFFCAIPIILLTSCDPPMGLIIRANNYTSITVYTKNKIAPTDNTKGIIYVPMNDTINFSYGIGAWPKQEIIDLTENIDSIVFQSTKSKEKLTEQTDIQNYLMKQRKGLFKNFLIIESK